MQKIEVVIGSNYGDEGKGLFTEYLCRNRAKPIVVLSNGGCQRGHTVKNRELNIRHIFHHFGSGSLLGFPSIFSKTFILNPIKFVEEFWELEDYGIHPVSFRMPSCIVQLPSDMVINQLLERHRSKLNSKHGSCGWGIWETIVRNQSNQLSFEQFANMNFNEKRKYMLDELDLQVETRLKANDVLIDDNADSLLKIISNEGFIRHFIDDFNMMSKKCLMLESDDLLEIDYASHGIDVETLVVENAQGLLLDKKYAPKDSNGRTDVHSTPSKTGLEGALSAIGSKCNMEKLINCGKVSPNYISRTYMTRHGYGPFPEYVDGLHYDDATNIPNEYQDSMLFGKMTFNAARELLLRISNDAHAFDCIPKLVLTHMNEARCELLEENASYMSYEDDSSMILKK